MMKILISAYASEPGQGSEEGVGWNMALATAQRHDTWVLTRTFYKSKIEAELASNPVADLHFVYFEPLGWSKDWRNTQGAVQLHYYLWQVWAYFVALKLRRSHKFEIVHHITYVKFWSPSFLSLLPIPFVWGPVGGGEAAPKPFWKDFTLRAILYETLRDVAQRLGEQDPFTRITARRSVIAYTTTKDTAIRVEGLGTDNVQILSEAGLSLAEINYLGQFPMPDSTPIRFISCGRLLHWKGYHLSLKAFLKANIIHAEYWIVGDGPERTRLQSLIQDSGADNRVKLWGRLPRDKTLSLMSQSHILVHPSLHDSGGWTCLEAMAAGRPVICLNLGGPSVQVTEETGIKVPAIDPEQAVNDTAKAMILLAADPELRQRKGEAAKKRIRDVFDWAKKAQFYDKEYRQILSSLCDQTYT